MFVSNSYTVAQVEQILNVAWKDKGDKSGSGSLRERLEKNYNEILR